MWRNFGKFWRSFEKFWEILGNFAFIWRKIEPKKYICGEKITNKKSAFKSKNVPSQHLKTTENEEDLTT